MSVDREVGALPLSIGTSLAIEGLLGTHPGKPHQPSGHRGITALWINIRTLVRNYREAFSKENIGRIKFDVAALSVLTEMQAIPEIIRQANRDIKVVYYFQPTEDINQQFPKASLKKAKTDTQFEVEAYAQVTLRLLLAECNNEKINVVQIRRQPPTNHDTTALITHYPKDLFWKNCFGRLFLLESHTGRLKTYVDWYTKLNVVNSDSLVLFFVFTIQVFGDSHLFNGQDRKMRAELKELAKVKRWNGTTSYERVAADIKHFGSIALKKLFVELMP